MIQVNDAMSYGKVTSTEHKSVIVGGFKTGCVSRAYLVSQMQRDCVMFNREKHDCKLIFDLNGQGIAMAYWNPTFRDALEKADLIHADGEPIVWASRLLTGNPIPERTGTTDFFHDAAVGASQQGISFYLLGATEDVNAQCTVRMKELYPSLRIAGRRNGYFSEGEEEKLCIEINESGADVLWVGLGKPKEHEFCVRNKHRLKVAWVVTCGGCYHYVVGTYPRAPMWMQKCGLEWLHRMLTRPKQLFWRYLTTNPVCFALLLLRTRDIDKQLR